LFRTRKARSGENGPCAKTSRRWYESTEFREYVRWCVGYTAAGYDLGTWVASGLLLGWLYQAGLAYLLSSTFLRFGDYTGLSTLMFNDGTDLIITHIYSKIALSCVWLNRNAPKFAKQHSSWGNLECNMCCMSGCLFIKPQNTSCALRFS
jgi:hypothetical protein